MMTYAARIPRANRRIPGRSTLSILFSGLLFHLFCAGTAQARTISVTTADDYHAIEAAQPGDVVEIAPGTYKFRVSLEKGGTAMQPIVIRARDMAQRPVWDLTGTTVGAAPGSYTGGDKGRGCWQVRAGHYHIQGLVFKSCLDVGSAGVRIVNVPDVWLTSCLFQNNVNGVTGAGDDIRIAFSEFGGNGLVYGGGAANHSLYVYGGTLDVRYSYFHDSPSGQHFHVRSRDATLAYNWFTRPGSYTGDIMPCEHFCGGADGQPVTQRMLLLGNVIVQGAPSNPTKLLTLYKDESGGSVDMTGVPNAFELTMINNTLVGTSRPGGNAVVQLRNDTIKTTLHASNNVALSFSAFGSPQQPGNYTIDGAGNWMTAGTTDTGLVGSTFGKDAGLSGGYVPQKASAVLGTAKAATPLPAFEYYRDERLSQMGRARASVKDPGAFESTTQSVPFGPEGGGTDVPDMAGGGSTDMGGAQPDLPGGGSDDGGGMAPPAGGGCAAAGGGSDAGWGLLVIIMAAVLASRRHARG